jgi:hypothetical protein
VNALGLATIVEEKDLARTSARDFTAPALVERSTLQKGRPERASGAFPGRGRTRACLICHDGQSRIAARTTPPLKTSACLS